MQGWSPGVVDTVVVVYKLVMRRDLPETDRAIAVSKFLTVSVSAKGRHVSSAVCGIGVDIESKS